MGDMDEACGPCLQPGPDLASAATWGVSQQVKDLSSSLLPVSVTLSLSKCIQKGRKERKTFFPSKRKNV